MRRDRQQGERNKEGKKKKPLRIINDVERNGIGRDLLELSQNCRHDAAIKEEPSGIILLK